MAYTMTIGLLADAEGLTFSAQLINSAGSNVGSAVTTGFIDLGDGYYSWTYTGFPDAFRGVVTFTADAEIKAILPVNPQGAEYLDSKVSSRAPSGGGGGRVTVFTPVADDLDVTLVRGDDYNADDDRALRWTGAWPELTGTIAFTARRIAGGDPLLTAAGEITGAQEVQVELVGTDTDDLRPGTYRYDVQATLTSGRKVTLAIGRLTLIPDETR